MPDTQKTLLVTGGAGYLGAVLVPKLLAAGHRVTVLDAFYFGRAPLDAVSGDPKLTLVEGDIRDHAYVDAILRDGGFDAVIHLAAISNDPCSDLDPELTRGVNRDATEHLMREAKRAGVSRFIYASSASVYGIKDDPDVTEELSLEPITLYARYKAEGEAILGELVGDDFCGVSVRAATVCGFSPRLRLDLTINILTHHALTRGGIRVFGGTQMRPNIHIDDLTDLYVRLVDIEADKVNGLAFNVSTENATVMALAEMIRDEIDPAVPIEVVPTEDLRSYHLSAERARRELGFTPKRSLADAVRDLKDAYAEGRVPDPDAAIYRNVELMKAEAERWRTPGRGAP